MRRLRIPTVVVVGLGILVLAFVQMRRIRSEHPPLLPAQEALLSRQNQELVKLATAAENGTLLGFEGMLIVVDQVLVRDLLRAVTPIQADVGSGFHMKIDSADASFGDGVALVSLTGTASVGGASVGSRVKVLAAIDVVELHPVSGVLECRVSVLGVEAQDARALGHTGREAVELTRKLRPAVVVMDIAMPLLNGLEATRQIRKEFPGIRVLILSAHSDDAHMSSRRFW